ncbi:hypothetical protein BJ742DRAFT_381727 [Cladochytrium replicatum]|nr:hypothetical protein BJ742DRAFT_381727 [Cladochytrium replicatum]
MEGILLAPFPSPQLLLPRQLFPRRQSTYLVLPARVFRWCSFRCADQKSVEDRWGLFGKGVRIFSPTKSPLALISMYQSLVPIDRGTAGQRVGVPAIDRESSHCFCTCKRSPHHRCANRNFELLRLHISGASFTIEPIKGKEACYQTETGLVPAWELSVNTDLCNTRQNVFVDSSTGTVVGVPLGPLTGPRATKTSHTWQRNVLLSASQLSNLPGHRVSKDARSCPPRATLSLSARLNASITVESSQPLSALGVLLHPLMYGMS